MKTTENSRIWKYDTQGTENRSTALVPPQASTALTNNACEEKAKGTPIPALVGFHREDQSGLQSPGPKNQNVPKKSEWLSIGYKFFSKGGKTLSLLKPIVISNISRGDKIQTFRTSSWVENR